MSKEQTANKMADTAVVTELPTSNKDLPNEMPKRKGDFTPKYYNAQEIIEDKELQPAEQVCELVKHYSMCLFGIATDISDFYEQLAERDKKLAELTTANSALRQRNGLLSYQVTMSDKTPQEVLDELIKLRKDNCHLKQVLRRYKEKYEDLLNGVAIVEFKEKIRKLSWQCTHWKARAEELEALNKVLTERKTDGK